VNNGISKVDRRGDRALKQLLQNHHRPDIVQKQTRLSPSDAGCGEARFGEAAGSGKPVWAADRRGGQAMASWQLKGLLLLGTALVATALAASTSRALPRPSLEPAAIRTAATAATHNADVETMVTKPSANW
jgi:hypothetical protein